MVEWGKSRGTGRGPGDTRAGGQAEAQTETWPPGGARRGRALAWPDSPADLGRALAAQIRDWIVADTGPGRLMPWLPIAFGFGIAVYFTAEREPAWWAALALTLGCAV